MTINEFKKSSSNTNPPSDVAPTSEVQWHQANGNWDLANAGYWNWHADKLVATGTIQEEWEQLASALI